MFRVKSINQSIILFQATRSTVQVKTHTHKGKNGDRQRDRAYTRKIKKKQN